MTNSYLYSIKVNEALQSYGARTHGSLARRVERLKRFTDMKNKQYAAEIRLEHARMMANQEREERVQNRIRELQNESAPVFLRRNLRKNTDMVKMKKEAYLTEPQQEVEIPMTSRRPSHSYNLRSRQESGMTALWQAIQNGFVNVNRG
jgi:hypothetical protein